LNPETGVNHGFFAERSVSLVLISRTLETRVFQRAEVSWVPVVTGEPIQESSKSAEALSRKGVMPPPPVKYGGENERGEEYSSKGRRAGHEECVTRLIESFRRRR
jgi:hypothetical protein